MRKSVKAGKTAKAGKAVKSSEHPVAWGTKRRPLKIDRTDYDYATNNMEGSPAYWYYGPDEMTSRYPYKRKGIVRPSMHHKRYCKPEFLKKRGEIGTGLGRGWRASDRCIDTVLTTDLAFEVFLGHWKSVENHIHKTPPQVYLSTLD